MPVEQTSSQTLKDPSFFSIPLKTVKDLTATGFHESVVLVLVLFILKKSSDWIYQANQRAIANLMFSQRKDQEINNLLQTLRESIGCDRVVLGLVINGETNISGSYHIQKLVVTHESCRVGVESVAKKKDRVPLVSLRKEIEKYKEDDSNAVYAIASDNTLDPACRAYLDSIDCLGIYTTKLEGKLSRTKFTLGYLSFQWTKIEPSEMQYDHYLDEILLSKKQRDLLYFKNRLVSIVSDMRSRFGLIKALSKLVLSQKN